LPPQGDCLALIEGKSLDFELTVSDDEFDGLAELLHLALLVNLVGLLMVDEEVGGALATHPAL